MTARVRVASAVALAAVAAAGITMAATMLTATDDETTATEARPRAGFPPLVLDLGVRTDPEARALRRALALYEQKRRVAAGRVFRQFRSPEADVGAAMAAWPDSLSRLEAITRREPRSGAVLLNLGLVRYWLRDAAGARSAWKRAKKAEPNSLYGVRAGDLLHPEDPVPGLPAFVPSFRSPPELDRLGPPAQLAFLQRAASSGGAREKLLYGVALQRLNRPISARREFDAAAALAPNDPETLTAAAVGRFDKDRPQDAFSRLGPLSRRFPKVATVRFHLGLLLLWMGQVEQAKVQLQKAVAVEPASTAATQAREFLDRLG